MSTSPSKSVHNSSTPSGGKSLADENSQPSSTTPELQSAPTEHEPDVILIDNEEKNVENDLELEDSCITREASAF